MSTDNTLGSAIWCAAAGADERTSLRCHPLAFRGARSSGPGGQNRGAVVYVHPHTRNFRPRHPGSGQDFFGLGHSGERS